MSCRASGSTRIAWTVPPLDLHLFAAKIANANRDRRNALANRATEAANLIAAGNSAGAIGELSSLLEKIDGAPPPPDWKLDSIEKTAVADEVRLLIELLALLE